MPINEISAESVRVKSIRHGHISTLHLWRARQPLPVFRAVVFASLVPEPLDENCPQAFRDAEEIFRSSSPTKCLFFRFFATLNRACLDEDSRPFNQIS